MIFEKLAEKSVKNFFSGSEIDFDRKNSFAFEMNPMGTLNALGSASCLGRNSSQFTTQSIVKAMDNFLNAVNNMKEVVMVPSRLQGVPYQIDAIQASAQAQTQAQNHGAVVAAAAPTAPAAADFKHFDCYNAYEVLNMVRSELVCGGDDELGKIRGTPTDQLEKIRGGSAGAADFQAEETAINLDYKRSISAAIRMHLQGLFQSLHQLTDLANGLTRKYQDQVDGN